MTGWLRERPTELRGGSAIGGRPFCRTTLQGDASKYRLAKRFLVDGLRCGRVGIARLRGMSVICDVEHGAHATLVATFHVAPERERTESLKVLRLRRKAEVLKLLSARRAEDGLSRRRTHDST
jgi:hypothetical protein